MLIRTTKQPVILAIRLANWQIVDARQAPCHETIFVEFPVFVSIGMKSIAAIIMPFVNKSDCYAMFAKNP
jgi:hypothetical protein